MLQTFKNFFFEPYYNYLNRKDARQFQKDRNNYPHVYKNAMEKYKKYKDKNTSPYERDSLSHELKQHQSEMQRMQYSHHPEVKVKDHYGFLLKQRKEVPLKHWHQKHLDRYSKEFSYTYPEMEKLTQEHGGDLPEEFYTNNFILHPSDRKLIKNEIERREFLNAKF